jgi:hypothetical protein
LALSVPSTSRGGDAIAAPRPCWLRRDARGVSAAVVDAGAPARAPPVAGRVARRAASFGDVFAWAAGARGDRCVPAPVFGERPLRLN